MPVAAILQTDRVVSRPRHHVRSAGRQDLVAPRTPIVLVGGCSGDLPHVPVAVRMTLAALATERIQRSFVIAIITHSTILTAHD